MKLTKKQAIDRSIKEWTWLAETGELKEDWPGWKGYVPVRNYCFLCGYCGADPLTNYVNCKECPLGWGQYGCEDHPESQYANWIETIVFDDEDAGKEDRKKYAALFLEQLKELKK